MLFYFNKHCSVSSSILSELLSSNLTLLFCADNDRSVMTPLLTPLLALVGSCSFLTVFRLGWNVFGYQQIWRMRTVRLTWPHPRSTGARCAFRWIQLSEAEPRMIGHVVLFKSDHISATLKSVNQRSGVGLFGAWGFIVWWSCCRIVSIGYSDRWQLILERLQARGQ